MLSVSLSAVIKAFREILFPESVAKESEWVSAEPVFQGLMYFMVYIRQTMICMRQCARVNSGDFFLPIGNITSGCVIICGSIFLFTQSDGCQGWWWWRQFYTTIWKTDKYVTINLLSINIVMGAIIKVRSTKPIASSPMLIFGFSRTI